MIEKDKRMRETVISERESVGHCSKEDSWRTVKSESEDCQRRPKRAQYPLSDCLILSKGKHCLQSWLARSFIRQPWQHGNVQSLHSLLSRLFLSINFSHNIYSTEMEKILYNPGNAPEWHRRYMRLFCFLGLRCVSSPNSHLLKVYCFKL